jgi:hypothetical protein
MSQFARVQSLDALKDFRVRLLEFGVSAQQAVGSTEMELRRLQDWIGDQLKHWQKVVREQEEFVTRAKSELMHRKHWKKGGEGPGYTEQEIALRKAQARLKEAQEKVENCRRWTIRLPQAITEYEGPARLLTGMMDADLKQSAVLLERKIASLEAYLQMTPPDGSGGLASAAPASAAPEASGTAVPAGGSQS